MTSPGDHVARRQLLGIQPQPHRIVAGAEDRQVADARQPGQLVLDLQRDVVAQIERIAALVGRINRDAQRDVRRRLLHHDALALHVQRQQRLRDRHPVLHLHLSDIQIRAELERHGQHHGAVVRALARHVDHAFDAVDLLLDRRGHRLGDRLGVGAGIVGG